VSGSAPGRNHHEISASGPIGSGGRDRYNQSVPGAATNDGWAAPPLSELIVRTRAGAALPTERTATSGAPELPEVPERVVADLLAVRGAAGRFLVPGDSRHTAARSLLSYNRLRPARVRTVRAAMGWTLRLGAGGLISEPRQMRAPADAPVLLDHLASVLDVPRVVFAATEKGGSGFVTPVLQLFTPDGRNVGFAKIGWDAVTDAMIRTEAESLQLAARAGWDSVSVPEVVWHGEWEDLSLLVTAPMPRNVRRLRESELPPIPPLLDVAMLDGPTQRHRIDASSYWSDARAAAADATGAGRSGLARHLDTVEHEHADVELTFGRWHGDWVEWNLAQADGHLFAWDWAYSAPDVPFGFDLLQFFHLRHRVLREEPPAVALANAAADARPGLRQLGIPADEVDAVIALHHTEVLLREERALQARSEVRQ
jgi:hypothetical protein